MNFIPTKEIKNLKINAEVNSYLRVINLRTQETTAGKKYLALTLGDKYGQIHAKIWDMPDASFSEGDIIKFVGKYDEYNSMPQLVITPNSVRKVTEKEHAEAIKNVLPSAFLEEKAYLEYIHKEIVSISDEELKNIVVLAMKKYHSAFSKVSAALMWHDTCINGLLQHTVKVLQYAEAFIQCEAEMPTTKDIVINRDLVVTAAILHDLMKVYEYAYDENGLATGFTPYGNLLGHVAGGTIELCDLCKQLNLDCKSEKIMLLAHMLLAHHGKKEAGSPVEPLFLEALILHKADDAAAQVNNIIGIELSLEEGAFTERTFETGKRAIYRPHAALAVAKIEAEEGK